LYIEKYLKKHF